MKQFYSMMDEPDVPSSFWQYNSLQVGDTEFLSKSDKAERVEKEIRKRKTKKEIRKEKNN